MTREWAPGDVALVNNNTEPSAPWLPATCIAARTTSREATWVLHGSGARVWGSVSDARPLLILDPESDDDAHRLIRVFWDHHNDDCDDEQAMRDAMRSLVAPPQPPKPEEPQGLGAVVEDAGGYHWVRAVHDNRMRWWNPLLGGWNDYADIAAVRILSDGVS